MSENISTEILDTDLFTGTPEELAEATEETAEMVLEDIVRQIATDRGTVNFTAFAVMEIVNKVFKVTMTDKQVPSQMGYNYTRNGMIAKRTKGMAGKDVRYTFDETVSWVLKYTSKFIQA